MQRNWENRKRFCFTKVYPYIFEMVYHKTLPFINLMNFKKSVLYITSFNAVGNVVFFWAGTLFERVHSCLGFWSK